MEQYFNLMANQLLNNLAQVKVFITNHNPTIGILTEEVIRDFLKEHLPKFVSVEQGFIINAQGDISKQCDILIYDSLIFSPIYRIKEIVVVPESAVLAIIEVKTTITKAIFHSAIKYFDEISKITNAKKYLFVYNSKNISSIDSYFHSYKHPGDYQEFDHDTFQYLPDCITGLSDSYHLSKDFVPYFERDSFGYTSWVYEGIEGTEINALQHFYESIYSLVSSHIESCGLSLPSSFEISKTKQQTRELKYLQAIELFPM